MPSNSPHRLEPINGPLSARLKSVENRHDAAPLSARPAYYSAEAPTVVIGDVLQQRMPTYNAIADPHLREYWRRRGIDVPAHEKQQRLPPIEHTPRSPPVERGRPRVPQPPPQPKQQRKLAPIAHKPAPPKTERKPAPHKPAPPPKAAKSKAPAASKAPASKAPAAPAIVLTKSGTESPASSSLSSSWSERRDSPGAKGSRSPSEKGTPASSRHSSPKSSPKASPQSSRRSSPKSSRRSSPQSSRRSSPRSSRRSSPHDSHRSASPHESARSRSPTKSPEYSEGFDSPQKHDEDKEEEPKEEEPKEEEPKEEEPKEEPKEEEPKEEEDKEYDAEFDEPAKEEVDEPAKEEADEPEAKASEEPEAKPEEPEFDSDDDKDAAKSDDKEMAPKSDDDDDERKEEPEEKEEEKEEEEPKDEAPLPDSTVLTPEERERQLAVENRKATVSKFYASIEAEEGSAALLASADVEDGYVTCDPSLDPPLQSVKAEAPTAQQHLRLEANDDGYVRVLFGEGLVLTATSETAVGVAEKDDTDAQLWEVIEFSNGHFGLESLGFVKRLVEAVLDADPVTFALVSDDDSSSFCEFVPKKAEE